MGSLAHGEGPGCSLSKNKCPHLSNVPLCFFTWDGSSIAKWNLLARVQRGAIYISGRR